MIVSKLTPLEVERLLLENKTSKKKTIKLVKLLEGNNLIVIHDTKVTICMLNRDIHKTAYALRNRYGKSKDKYSFARAISICMGRLMTDSKLDEMPDL